MEFPNTMMECSSESSSSSEDENIADENMYLKIAVDNCRGELKNIKKTRMLILAEQLRKKRVKKNLKTMLKGATRNAKSGPFQRITLKRLTQSRPVRIAEDDPLKLCYSKITIDTERTSQYHLTVKQLLSDMKRWIHRYTNFINLDIFVYVISNVLEKRLQRILEHKHVEGKIRYKTLQSLYRREYPLKYDKAFLEETIVNIAQGVYNDPETNNTVDSSDISQDSTKTSVQTLGSAEDSPGPSGGAPGPSGVAPGQSAPGPSGVVPGPSDPGQSGAGPGTPEAALIPSKTTPGPLGVAPETPDASPKTTEMALETQDTVSGTTKTTAEIAPGTPEAVTITKDGAPGSPQVGHGILEAASNATVVASITTENTSGSPEVDLGTPKAAPIASETASITTVTAPITTETAPMTAEDNLESSELAPNTSKVTPVPPAVAPGATEGTTED